MTTDQSTKQYDIGAFKPLNISPWLAISLLHKSIRRSRLDLALCATATLLLTAPERLRRRLGVIAFEDVGIADIELVKAAVIAIKCTGYSPVKPQNLRGQVGQIVSSMAEAKTCRAADDLLVVCNSLPALKTLRTELAPHSIPQLLSKAGASDDVITRALCLNLALSTRSRRSEERQQVFAWLEANALEPDIAELCRRGFKLTGESLCALFGLVWQNRPACFSPAASDALPPEELIGEIPCWAYDIHVREGRAAIASLLQGQSETARWCKAHISGHTRVNFLGGVLFRIEGGLVTKRLCWPLADELREMADLECHGVDRQKTSEIRQLLRYDLPRLNEERRYVVAS